ncbi:single-stranded DNA-binding protein [Zunongwangia profunda]|jgi:single-strand DNA-binding protein|uniref:single-stranded DNA-binding protein n=1 Tax=Zunongwangia profunda TaxID=398743 RepID=UPI001D19015E|nr:single-stranded DNA-binding protein [Zunongwangia profunda]MCC4230064.1 single-stranded DNA-binding protein [Zunongwangia profunda]|tara:strand:+ start:9528 stop:9863 length:336 start_codon:yes stop_codon:yes gene_type:complete
MSNLRNKVQLIGNVGNTPEITNLDISKKVARLSIATNDYYHNTKGESVQDTQWHNLVAWNKNAELIENYVPKGKEIAIEGKLISRSYEDKEGNTRYITEILVNEIQLLGAK